MTTSSLSSFYAKNCWNKELFTIYERFIIYRILENREKCHVNQDKKGFIDVVECCGK